MPKHEMSKSAAANIQSTQAKSGGDMSSRGFAARGQSAADRNQNASAGQQNVGSRTGGQSGNNGGSARSGGAKK
ncbi:hypothetical protein F4820DRAFT_405220 [Hypoxylon rubiginosum]|uniref:Uncharacterized protein n=1 Tax=Hypoxylon rubiginosum TaxID=110542 RepID=A0ACB9ZEN6_9PEZI|nr:hypothetical protein F4820DRAFT_405220 [Hypoxylon rubiginosum]